MPLINTVPGSALLLLVLRILANNHYFAFSLDYFAFLAHRLYGSSYFHFVSSLCFASPCDSSPGQVIR